MATINKPTSDRHPSYGYATPEEIEQLKQMKIGVEYYELLKKIEKRAKQTKKKR